MSVDNENLELKKCPYCGGMAIQYGRTKKKIKCKECGASTSTYDLLSEAVEAWNKRTINNQMVAE